MIDIDTLFCFHSIKLKYTVFVSDSFLYYALLVGYPSLREFKM